MEKKELGEFKSYKEIFNWFPRSVWEVSKRSNRQKEMYVDDLEKHEFKRTKDGFPVAITQKLSVFNPELGERILTIWSNVGDIVLDPFAGRDRALITNFMERNYIGFEISGKTFNAINEKINKWKFLNKNHSIKMLNDDGTLLSGIEKNSIDFIYSCPPYWFREKYESVPGQISDIKTHSEWLEAINRCAENCFNVLKNEKYATFLIADIRDRGKIIPLHVDWINEFSKYFNVHDITINKTNPLQVSGVNGFLRNKFMLKSHEYIITFKKKI